MMEVPKETIAYEMLRRESEKRIKEERKANKFYRKMKKLFKKL